MTEPKTPPPHPHRIDEKIHKRPIADDESQENGQVLPLVARVHVQRGHVLDAAGVLAVSAVGRGGRIRDVSSANGVDVRLRVLATCHTRRGIKRCRFVGRASDGYITQRGGDDAADPVRGRIQKVHPVMPEDGELA